MSLFKFSYPQQINSDIVNDFRNQVYMKLGFAIAPFILPFSLYSFIQNRYTLGFLALILVVVMMANAITIHRHRRVLIDFWYLYMVILASLLWGMTAVGDIIVLWSFPLPIAVLFIAKRRSARIMIALAMVLLIGAGSYAMEGEFLIRYAITFSMTCYLCDLMVVLLSDVQTQLTTLAITDPLTGAFNRRQLKSHLKDAIEDQQRGLIEPSVIALDIDKFKSINDSFGHDAGDNVLREIVQLINTHKRKVDCLFRVGGEEFIILARSSPPAQPELFADNLRQRIEQASISSTIASAIMIRAERRLAIKSTAMGSGKLHSTMMSPTAVIPHSNDARITI